MEAKNFAGKVPMIDTDDAVMVLIDHQSGLFQCVQDMPFKRLRDHAIALAQAATLVNMPVILTASVPQGPNGPLIPEIEQVAPHAVYIPRRGEIRFKRVAFRLILLQSWRNFKRRCVART